MIEARGLSKHYGDKVAVDRPAGDPGPRGRPARQQTVEGAVQPLPGGLSLAAYRIVQEALTNVRKHAGPEAAAEVTLRYGQDELVIRVADDGRGSASRRRSFPATAPPAPCRRTVSQATQVTAWLGCRSGPPCTAGRFRRGRTPAAVSR